MSVEFVAPPGFAKLEESLSMKLNLHMIAIGSMLGNTAYVCQAYQKSRFMFPALGNVTVTHGQDNTDLTIEAGGRKITYQYHYRRANIAHCIVYDEDGKVIEGDVKTVQATYEAVVDYCTTLMVDRMTPKEEIVTTEEI